MHSNITQNKRLYERGFSLVEVLVTLALFTIIAVISLSSLIALVHANQKAQVLKSVINNLNFALENMERTIRVGHTYHCELTGDPVPPAATLATPKNCVNGELLALESSRGSNTDINDQTVYRKKGARIEISSDSGVTWLPLTSEEVNIESLKFIVTGTGALDGMQPFVNITLRVSTGATVKTFTMLSLQTSASQRLPDF